MATLIINNGARTGALLVEGASVRRLPRLDGATVRLLNSLNELLQALRVGRETFDAGATQLSNKLANQVIGRLENIVGSLDAEAGLIYDDELGGFVCGSEGKPPLTLPPTPDPFPDPLEFYDADMISVFEAASEKKFDLIELMEKPLAAAKELDIKISERTANELLQFAPSNLDKVKDPVAKEILGFLHKVIQDGEHLSDWPQRPKLVADKLGVSLSAPALDRLIGVGPVAGAGGAAVVIGVAILAGLVIVCAMECDRVVLNVRDRSGLVKF